MRTRIAYLRELLESSFWLTPALAALALIGLLPLAKALEQSILSSLPGLRSQTLEGTRLVLSAIATSMMTVVGVLFSVTIVVLQQVSQQYSPRVIENFIRSTANQLVLGFYIGTFAYCVLLLGTIQEEGQARAPVVAPAVAIALAMVCLALLIYFIHHLVKSIKSNAILAGMAREAVAAIDNLAGDLQRDESARLAPKEGATQVIRAPGNGYLQEIDLAALSKALGGAPWHARLTVLPGDYIHHHTELVQLIRAGAPLERRRRKALERAFRIDLARTHTQDIRFGVRQMADVALRALSPGINDPTTAVEALNEITTVLLHYARKEPRRPIIEFEGGGVLELREPEFAEFLDLCFNEVALAGRGFYRVQHAIEQALIQCERATKDAKRLAAIRQKRAQLAPVAAAVPGRDLYSGERSGAGEL